MYLLPILITVFGYSSQGEILFERQQASAYIDISVTPKIGEVFTVSYTFVPHMDAGEASYYPYVMKFSVNTYQEKNAYKIVTGQLENELLAIKKGEPTTYTISLMITKSVPVIQIGAGIPGRIAWVRFIKLYLIDPETGQYGTKEEYEGNLPAEYRYDPVDGSFTCSPSLNPAPVEENRRIIKMIRELEPRLSDSLALLLHSDQYRVGIPRGVSQWDSLNQRWIDKGVYEYYLRDGWFKALQEGKRDEWLKKEKAKIEQSW